MEAKLVDALPSGAEWWYEPKWDGFRCLAFRDGAQVELMSKAGKPLTRYFPEVIENLLACQAERFVLDGELVVAVDQQLSFGALSQRIHPAASRIKKLAFEWPAELIVFDLLVDSDGTLLTNEPLTRRRHALEHFVMCRGVQLSPITDDKRTADTWLHGEQTGLDGVIAKRSDLTYQSGERTGMEKVKHIRTADCVVGGFRYAAKGGGIGSLLLGLYDDGLLHHVGFTSSFKANERIALRTTVEPLIKPPGFTGGAPGGPSRWSTDRSTEWQPLDPTLVVEVAYDHFSDGRFRHGTTFRRWRPDKAPRQCTFDQLPHEGRSALRLLTQQEEQEGSA